MHLSFPHPLLVWSGHVESTCDIVVDYLRVSKLLSFSLGANVAV